MFFQKIFNELRKNKALYYIKGYLRYIVPLWIYERQLNKRLRAISNYDRQYLVDRVGYYNKLTGVLPIGADAIDLQEVQRVISPKVYRFDTFEYSRYFSKKFRTNVLFGDVTHVADVPTWQKSRPVADDNASAVLLKLEKKRHFFFITDSVKFAEKENKLFGRGNMTQPHRIRFMERYFDHPLCDLGQVNKIGGRIEWCKPKVSIEDHLKYKFILSLEGNDVATNLKWIMSSNSIAVMPRPRYETWFMEGRLIPDWHYIRIKDDYSDLVDRLEYYIAHPAEAEQIVVNANKYVKQFLDSGREDLISLLVMEKYFFHTSQIDKMSLQKDFQLNQ
jgi:hypothetical protein